jgi:hypothetical protein
MSIAPNELALKRRVDRYLWTNRSNEMAALQLQLSANFRSFSRVAIIGGLVRDFAREGRSGFKSDVDLVIEAPSEKVSNLATKLGARQNRFGGWGYKDGPWKIDFWALETTWARKYVPVQRLEDIVLTTFFDSDAVAYDLWDRRLICGEGYLDQLRRGTLEINLLPNPSPMGNLVRAVRRIVLWNVRPGPELAAFIDKNLDDETLQLVQSKEVELFRKHVSTRWQSAREAKDVLFRDPAPDDRSQLEIPLG